MFFPTQVVHHGFDVQRQIAHHCSSEYKKSQNSETVEIKEGKIRKAVKDSQRNWIVGKSREHSESSQSSLWYIRQRGGGISERGH